MAVVFVLAALTGSADSVSIGKQYRTSVSADVRYAVATERVATYPIATKPVFALDCSQTNGWTIVKDGSNRRVTRIPDLGGGSRYVTSDLSEIDYSQYGTYTLWYSGYLNIKGPIIRESDGVVKGRYLDFGAVQSYYCLFFNSASGDSRHNRLASVGTVIGVYKPATNNAKSQAGGQLLGGNDFQRHSGYDLASTKGVTRSEPILYKNAQAANVGGYLWKNMQRNNATFTYWSQGWQVVAYNPTAASLEAYGVGVGNCENCDFSCTSGGQAISELMVFDTVLSESDLIQVIKYLMQKWLPETVDGQNGAARMSSISVFDKAEYPSDGHTIDVDVPSGETLTLDALRGGRSSTAQKLVKTGAGSLTLNDSHDFGGEIDVNGGSLVFAAKDVPTFAQLPADMTLHLDPSDTSTMAIDGEEVDGWTNLLWSTRNVYAYCESGANKPTLVADALGSGLNVLDFGSSADGTGAYMTWSGSPKFATVVAVVDARIHGGGELLEDPFHRGNHFPTQRNTSWTAVFYGSTETRAIAGTWVNGRAANSTSDGYEAPTWQVVAFRAPATESSVAYLGAHKYGTYGTSYDAGGFRLGEFVAYDRSLSEEEIRDVTAYLMKKWLGRTPPGYVRAKAGLIDLQNVTAAEDVEIDVPAGKTMTIANLNTTGGAAVKVGDGQLVLGPGSNLAGGLTVREGTIAMGEADVASSSEVAAEPMLHLDASAPRSHYDMPVNGTNFVFAWQSMSGRSAAYPKLGNDTTRMPFLNSDDEARLNGLPVMDFGEQYGWVNKGRFMNIWPEAQNVRAAYVVYGSQAKGGQIFGAYGNQAAYKDFARHVGSEPTLNSPLFAWADAALANGEIYTNGVRIAASEARTFKPTGGYQLIEVHPTAGLGFGALATGYGGHFLYGGCRMGEVIVYEHPLSEREKVATRNYLLKKWFPDSPLTPLPSKTLTPLSGSIAYGAGTAWHVTVGSTGVQSGAMAVTGTLSFAAGTTLNLTGLASLSDLRRQKLLIAKAGRYSGLDNLTITGDITFTDETRPHLWAWSNGDLYVRFGQNPLMFIVR